MAVYTEISALFKDLTAIAKKVKDAELNNAILSLQNMAMDQNNTILDLRQKLAAYESQDSLESRIRVKNSVIEIGDDSQKYCVRCWGKYRKLNPVVIYESTRFSSSGLGFECRTCGQFGSYFGSKDDITEKQ